MATTVTDLKARAAQPQQRGRDIAKLPRDKQFPAMLDAFKSEISRALPRHLNPDRMARIALTAFRQTPALANCEPASVFAAIIQASQLGLEPGLMGQAYLIPYGNQCQFIPGYQGLVDLVRRSGMVKRIEAHVVHDRDQFTYRTGMTTVLEHEPCLDGDSGALRLAYAIAELNDGGYHVEVMTRQQIEAIRDRPTPAEKRKGIKVRQRKTDEPWFVDAEEMWRKTVVRRICKYLPKSAEMAQAIALDDAAQNGAQGISIEDAIEGTWAPSAESDEQIVTSVGTIDAGTGEILPESHAAPEDDRYADWRAAIDETESREQLTGLINTMPADAKKALREALVRRQSELVGKTE